MKKIACEVGVHHLRRMLGLVPAGGAAALLGGMGGSRMPPPGPPPPPHPGMGPMGLDGPPDLGQHFLSNIIAHYILENCFKEMYQLLFLFLM